MRVLMLAALVAAAPASAQAPAPLPDAATAFAQLAGLVGTWRNAEQAGSALRVHFYLTAGGTVLVEDWRRGDQPHSLTLYHRDGAALIATHYCPQGNQPRLQLRSGGRQLKFSLRDATDLDSGESHQHELTFDLTDPTRLLRGETYLGDGRAETDRLTLMRS